VKIVKAGRQDIENRARELFDESVEGVDFATRSRLTQARHAALAELERPRFRLAPWLPAAAAATVAAIAVAVWLPQEQNPEAAVAAVDDFEMLTLGEDLDMLGEDIEFYAWATSVEAGNGQG
jgi:hypothetical protein